MGDKSKIEKCDMKRIHGDSKLQNPFGFLKFLNNVGCQPEAFDLTLKDLEKLKLQTLDSEGHSSDAYYDKIPAESSCSLKFACDEDSSSNLSRQFEANLDFKDELEKAVNMGQGESTNSIKEGRNKLWNREFPPNQEDISNTRFIPDEFLENIPEIPNKYKDFYPLVKCITSAVENMSKLIPNGKKNSDDTDLLLKKMKWAQTLIDVWQSEYPEQITVRESLWKEKDWLDTLTAPLFKYEDESDFLRSKLRHHLNETASLDVSQFLKDLDSPVSINGQHSKAQGSKKNAKTKNTLTNFWFSGHRLLATFFVSQVLGITARQSEPMVQKYGTFLGNLFEKKVFVALKNTVTKNSQWITIFCGLALSGNVQRQNEFDFLIILGQVKKIIYVECKYTLREDVAKKIKKQSDNAFEFLQTSMPVTKGWEFLTLACFEETASILNCSKCQPILLPVSHLETSLAKIINESENNGIENGTTKKDYEDLIKTFLFLASANKQIVESGQVAKHQLKMVDFPAQSIILWNLHQLRILHKDPHKMIIRGQGRFGTGKTEILKAKAMKLAKDQNNRVAFLVARPYCPKTKPDLLVTKQLQYQLKSHKNIKVTEMRLDLVSYNEIKDKLFAEMLPQPDPTSETGPLNKHEIHVFIDEATKDHRKLITEILAQLPNSKGSDPYFWIVDTDKKLTEMNEHEEYKKRQFSFTLSDSLSDDFEIEEGLFMNLRNSQEIQKTIPFIHESSPTLYSGFDPKELTENIVTQLKQDKGAKQILVIIGKDNSNIVKRLNEIEGIKFYGLSPDDGVQNCSDEGLERFFDAPNQKSRQILVTVEAFVEGLEVEMVLFDELHNYRTKSTILRGKTKLKTATLKESAHPALMEQYSGLKQEEEIRGDLSFSDLTNLSIKVYSRFQARPDSKWTPSYIHCRPNLKGHDLSHWRDKLEKALWIKQYEIALQQPDAQDPTKTRPILLLWMEMPADSTGNICLSFFDHPLCLQVLNASSIRPKVEIVELVLENQLREWNVWIHILTIEIIHSHRLKIELNRRFNFRRLFSIWSRIQEECQRRQYIQEEMYLDDESSDQFRKKMLMESLFYGYKATNVKAIFESYVVNDPPFQHWNLFDDLVHWICPRLDSPMLDFLILREIPHYKAKEWANANQEPQEVDKLRRALYELICFRPKETLSILHRPLVSLIWEKHIFLRFREGFKNNCPHFVKEPWYPGFVSAEEECKMDYQKLQEARGHNSIYLQPEEKDDTAFERVPLRRRAVFVEALIFIASQ